MVGLLLVRLILSWLGLAVVPVAVARQALVPMDVELFGGQPLYSLSLSLAKVVAWFLGIAVA